MNHLIDETRYIHTKNYIHTIRGSLKARRKRTYVFSAAVQWRSARSISIYHFSPLNRKKIKYILQTVIRWPKVIRGDSIPPETRSCIRIMLLLLCSGGMIRKILRDELFGVGAFFFEEIFMFFWMHVFFY